MNKREVLQSEVAALERSVRRMKALQDALYDCERELCYLLGERPLKAAGIELLRTMTRASKFLKNAQNELVDMDEDVAQIESLLKPSWIAGHQ